MTQIPDSVTVFGQARDEGYLKTNWFNPVEAVLKEIDGGAAEAELTIASGSVTPTGAAHTIDTEADAASDDLANILTTNHPPGRVIAIRAQDAGRTVVVKNAATGAGEIITRDGNDFPLDDTGKRLWLMLVGTQWLELRRSYGSDRGQELADQGAFAGGTLDKSATYTVVLADRGRMIDFDTSGGNRTADLPAVASVGKSFPVGFRKATTDTNTLTLDPNGGETIDGATTLVLDSPLAQVWLIPDGANCRAAVGPITQDTLRQGRHTFTVRAKEMTPTTANGAAPGLVELPSNDVMLEHDRFS